MEDPDQGYAPDFDEYGRDINRPLDDEETAALHRLDTGQGWLDQNPPTRPPGPST